MVDFSQGGIKAPINAVLKNKTRNMYMNVDRSMMGESVRMNDSFKSIPKKLQHVDFPNNLNIKTGQSL